MNVPHGGGHRARSQATCMGLAIAVEEEIAPRKRAGSEFPRSTCECAAEVIVWVGVLSRKPWTAVTQDGCDLWGGRATLEQFFGDPFIGDAPVGPWEAFQNPQPLQPTGIDFRAISDCGRASQPVCAGRISVRGGREKNAWRPHQVRVAAQIALGRLQQSSALGSRADLGVQPREGSRASCAAVVSDW
jgi:hypothetical protein